MPRESSSSVRIFYPKCDREELISKLREKIKELSGKLPLSLVVLFGSYARGNNTVASDRDLLIVYGGKKREDAYAVAKRTADIPMLEPHVHSKDEYQGLRRVLTRMIADGVVLFSHRETKDVLNRGR